MVDTVNIDGELVSVDEINAYLDILEPPLSQQEIQQLLNDANQQVSTGLAALLAALLVATVGGRIRRGTLVYSIRDKAYFNGRLRLSYADIQRRIEEEKNRNAVRFRTRTQQMIDGAITFEQWQAETIRDIIQSHVRMAQAGAGTAGILTVTHLENLRDTLRRELFNFQEFARQILSAGMSAAMMLYRAGRYGMGASVSFGVADKITHSDGRWLGRRFLDRAVIHCIQCPGHERTSWTSADDIVPIGVDCDCGGNCHCRIEWRLINLSDRLP